MANRVPPTPQKPSIKTPQELIHIKHKITLRQYKYWVLMLKAYREAYEEGEVPDAQGFYRMPVSEITEFLGYEPVRSELRADLEAIRREPIIYNVLGKDGQNAMRGAGFISEWEVSANWVGFKLPSFLSECVERLDLKSAMFQMLNWSVFNSFSGKYEAILYKLCKDYVGVRRTPYMPLSEFREYMGVGPEEYEQFKRLNQWVIAGPIKNLNESELCDIQIETILKREARKVVGLHFEVTPKHQSVLDFGDDPAFRFAKIAISLPQQKKYLAAHRPEEIEYSIQRANEYAEEREKKGEAVDLGAVYHTAITKEWGREYAAKLERERERQEAAKKQEEAAKKVAAQEKKAKTAANAEIKEKRSAAFARYQELAEDEQKAIWTQFLAGAGATSNVAKTKGLESAMVRKMFEIWLTTQEF